MRFVHLAILIIACQQSTYAGHKISCGLNQGKIQLNASAAGIAHGLGAGRVEICDACSETYDTCYWQTVSTGSTSEPMSWKNSIVICRQLGYYDVLSPILQWTVPAINTSVDIYSTTFVCDGTEDKLVDCDIGRQTDGLSHKADAYVNCQPNITDQKVRLTGTAHNAEGVVEYYIGGSWRTICPDSWTTATANLLCVSLGYDNGTNTTYSRKNFKGPNICTSPAVQSLSCNNKTVYFSSCTFFIGAICASRETLAGAKCSNSNSTAAGSVQLYHDPSKDYERVEVFYNGHWGTVCNIAWSVADGKVACRELGQDTKPSSIPDNSIKFNPVSSRPIWIMEYNCTGSESSLSSCTRPWVPVGYVPTACTHSTDAGLKCK